MLGSAIEADGCHTKAEGGIVKNVQAECLPADMVDHLSVSESSREYFPNLRQAG